MAHEPRTSFAPLASARSAPQPDGVWWPRSRSLADELPSFFAAWPAERGRIQRVLYSSPDWDDHPQSVAVDGRRVKTGTFPRDDTHMLTVSMEDRRDHLISVIDPTTPVRAARKALAAFPPARSVSEPGPHGRWDDDGGSS